MLVGWVSAIALAGWPGLTVHVDALPTHLDPRTVSADHGLRLVDLQYDRLFRYSVRKDTFDPTLLHDITLDPVGHRITARLTEAVWHDGLPVTASDVCFTLIEVPQLELGRDALLYRATPDLVSRCEVTDTGVTITLKHWPATDPRHVLDVPVLPAHATPANRPGTVGSGPYAGEVNVYEAFYRAVDAPHHSPYLKRLAFVVREPELAAREFPDGTADLLLPLHPAFLGDLAAAPEIDIDTGAGQAWALLALDPRDPHLARPKVREAIAHAIDRTDLVGTLWYGTTQHFDPAVYLRGSIVPEADAASSPLPTTADLKAVKSAMEEEGGEFGDHGWQLDEQAVTLRLAVRDTPRMQAVASRLADQLEAAGFRVERTTVPATGLSWTEMDHGRPFNAALGTWQIATDQHLADLLTHPRARDANPFDVHSKGIAALLASLAAATSSTERSRISSDVAARTAQDAVYLPLWNETPTAAWFRARLTDARFEPRYSFMWVSRWRQ